jgi:hypothetical protein
LKEQVLIADERVLTVRKEMQLEIDRLIIQISVYLEKITKKDADMRKLYIKIDVLNRERGGIEELKKRHLQELRNLELKYSSQIQELTIRAQRADRVDEYLAEIDRLKKIIQELQWEITQLKSRTATVIREAPKEDYEEEYEENFEVVGVRDVARASM